MEALVYFEIYQQMLHLKTTKFIMDPRKFVFRVSYVINNLDDLCLPKNGWDIRILLRQIPYKFLFSKKFFPSQLLLETFLVKFN